MSKSNKLSVSLIVFGAMLAWMPKAQAQSDQQVSIADAARKSREMKKDAPKPATVITNDTLEPEKPAAPSASSGTAPEAGAPNAAPNTNLTVTAAPVTAASGQAVSDSTAQPAAAPSQQEKDAKSADIRALKQRIAEKQSEVNLVQRAFSLASDDFYSRPDFSKDEEGKAKLDAMKSDLTQRQEELAELKAQLPADAGTEEKPADGQSESSSPSSAESQPKPDTQSQPQNETQPQQP
jgi:hypothetical protein